MEETLGAGDRNPGRGHAAAARTRTGEAVWRSEQTVHALLESASQAILAADGAGRIVVANARTEEMFGYRRDELLGQPLETLLPESMRQSHAQYRADYIERPRVRPMGIGMDLAGRRKDGAEFPVEVSLSYVHSDEGVFAIAFVTDISVRKQMQDQLLQARKMEAVGRLAGGVAHDFNNMLTIIAGYNRMLLDELPAADPLRGYAEEILKAADRAGALTNQLLTFSRRQLTQPKLIDLNALLANMENMLRRLIGEDVELTVRLAPELGPVKADPGQLEQAIFNLAANGRDAMPTGGRLSLETAAVALDKDYARTHLGVQPGPYIMVAVSDTGCGMDGETKSRIFEPFFTTKERGKGTGLGLSTVYAIVKQSGGDIWVYSEPGHGTTFKVYLPRAGEQPQDAAPVAGRPAVRPGTETILLVEDDRAVRDLVAEMLSQNGYRVLKAGDAREAIELSASSGEVHMLLTDVVMPNMSGKELAKLLASSRPELKVMFLSGYTEHTALERGVLEVGMEFLQKPFTREMLVEKIRALLDR